MIISRNKQKAQRQHAEHVRALLADRFPKCFAGQGQPKRPLKVGIGQDLLLQMPELSAYSIGVALEDYCWGKRYCASMIAGESRINLEGEPDGVVRPMEADHAALRLRMFDAQRAQPAPGEQGA